MKVRKGIGMGTDGYFMKSEQEKIEWRKKAGQRTLLPNSPVEKMETFCIVAVLQELKSAGLNPTDEKYMDISRRTAKLLIRNRRKNLIGYLQSKETLKEWLLWKLGLRQSVAFEKMKQMGLTGNVIHDLEVMK